MTGGACYRLLQTALKRLAPAMVAELDESSLRGYLDEAVPMTGTGQWFLLHA